MRLIGNVTRNDGKVRDLCCFVVFRRFFFSAEFQTSVHFECKQTKKKKQEIYPKNPRHCEINLMEHCHCGDYSIKHSHRAALTANYVHNFTRLLNSFAVLLF